MNLTSHGEAEAIRAAYPDKIRLLITPGIRPATSEIGDQKRVATPRMALAAGADYLVVGRPITGALKPAEVAQAIIAEMEEQ